MRERPTEELGADAGTVILSSLLEFIDEARAPVSEALASTEECPALNFAELRAALRRAYLLLGGDGDIDLRNASVMARRVAPYAIAHYAACNVAKLAQQVLRDGESPALTRELLDRSRELVRVLEMHLLKRRRASGENVVEFEKPASPGRGNTEGDAA